MHVLMCICVSVSVFVVPTFHVFFCLSCSVSIVLLWLSLHSAAAGGRCCRMKAGARQDKRILTTFHDFVSEDILSWGGMKKKKEQRW